MSKKAAATPSGRTVYVGGGAYFTETADGVDVVIRRLAEDEHPTKNPQLAEFHFSPSEWAAFVAAAKKAEPMWKYMGIRAVLNAERDFRAPEPEPAPAPGA